MKKILFTVMLSLLVTATMFATVKVTFKVNMGAAAFNGVFKIATDSVTVRGDFQVAAGDTAHYNGNQNWGGYYFKMTKGATDTIYSVTATFQDSSIGKSFQFKFVMDDGGWESSPNRTFVLGSHDTTLGPYWYNNDSTYNTAPKHLYTVTFICDLSSYIGTAVGKFDPSKDSIQIMGLSNWGGFTITDLTGNRVLQPDPFQVGIYTTTLQFSGPVGDSAAWKFKAFPDSVFGNGGGYENGANRWFYFTADTVDTVGPFVPNLTILQPGIKNPVLVTFRVDMRHAVDWHTKKAIDPNSIKFVGLKGSIAIFGAWGGNWAVADTADSVVGAPKTMWVLHDDGKNGDLVAGDHIYAIQFTLPVGTPSGYTEYKYGCDYPGVDTVNGGSTYLDNDLPFGVNHFFSIAEPGPIVINNVFNVQDSVASFTDVKKVDNNLPATYKLSQNYPNPFNPSTTINYSLPKSGLVTLKVYNILGQVVATLVNQNQVAGNYNVSFDASRLASGVYFYSIKAGNFSEVKKMMLLK
jgi:hypothetical protein